MACEQPAHDGQAQTEAAAGLALDEVLAHTRRQRGAGVAHPQAGGVQRHLHLAAPLTVRDGVAQQAGHGQLQHRRRQRQGGVARQLKVKRQTLCVQPIGVCQHPLLHQRHNGCRRRRSALEGGRIGLARHQQQGAHGLLHQQRGGVHRCQLLLHGRGQAGVALQAFDGHAHHRQRRAQFVAGVAREGLLAADEGTRAVQQRVEDAGQRADLVITRSHSQVLRQLPGRALRDFGCQPSQRCADAPRQQACPSQRQADHHQAPAEQPAQKFLAHGSHDELLAHLCDQPGRPAEALQRQQVIVPPLSTRRLTPPGFFSQQRAQLGRQAGRVVVHRDERATGRPPAALSREMCVLGLRLLLEQPLQEAVFDGVDEGHREQAEERAHAQREGGQRQHQPALQRLLHGPWPTVSACKRKPTPCTVTSMAVAKGRSSCWRSV